MMKARVGAQFVTLMCFVGYMGLEQFDMRFAPLYQDVKKVESILADDNDEQQSSSSQSGGSSS